MASNTEQETRLCGNCKRDIPMVNFTIHEIHCQRNISICKLCKEPIPTSDMEEHIATEHAKVTCKCNMTMEKNLLEEHERSSCPSRMIQCQFCDLELPCKKLGEHEEYCGARTERCEKCGSSVLTKDLKDHPTVCGKVTEQKKPAQTYPEYEGAWFDSLQYRNTFTDDMFSRMPKHVPSRFYGRSVLTRSLKTSNEETERNQRREQNREIRWPDGFDDLPPGFAELLEEDAIGVPHFADHFQPVTERNTTRPEPETSLPRRDPDFWKTMYSKDNMKRKTSYERNKISNDDSAPLNVPTSSSESAQLPCEFCEELFPVEDLILHQSGCQISAVTSNRRHSSSPRESARSYTPPVNSSQMVLLPCEFCGVLLEVEILFHHQAQCEKCPDSGKFSPHAPELLSNDVTHEEKPYRTFEAPASAPSYRGPTTAKVDSSVGINQYLTRESAARPPRPARTTLLANSSNQQPRMNNTLRDPNLEDTRRRNIEEYMRLHDNLSTRGASNRNSGSRSKVTNKSPGDVDKEE